MSAYASRDLLITAVPEDSLEAGCDISCGSCTNNSSTNAPEFATEHDLADLLDQLRATSA